MVRIVLGALILLIGSVGIRAMLTGESEDLLAGLILPVAMAVTGLLMIRSGWGAMAMRQALARLTPWCARCQEVGPTRYVVFYRNIGAVLAFFTRRFEGCVCRSCANGVFWRFTSVNVLLGWWSPRSLILNPLIILNNIVYWFWGLLARPARIPESQPDSTTESAA